jgi:hypothetical protein
MGEKKTNKKKSYRSNNQIRGNSRTILMILQTKKTKKQSKMISITFIAVMIASLSAISAAVSPF